MGWSSMLLLANVLLTLWFSTAKEVKSCNFPQIKNGGIINSEIHEHFFPARLGKSYIIYCNKGFGPFRINVIYCGEQGWEPKVPCLRQCVFHKVENGESSALQTKHSQGMSVKVKCFPGYRLPNGQDTVTCTENGWSPELKCIRVNNSCVDPPHVENATITWLSDEKIRYECNKPFEIFGDVEVICQNGTWTEPPRCRETTCKPPSIPNGFYFPQKTEYSANDTIIYDCKFGSYPAAQISLVRCTSNGWIPAPRCNSEPCDFPQIKNGGLYNENYLRKLLPVRPGMFFSYYCNKGYMSSSSRRSIICAGQGWEPEVPCVKECNFSHVENRKFSVLELLYKEGQSAKVECQPGYSPPNGQDIVTCTENGWSPQPKCIRVNP